MKKDKISMLVVIGAMCMGLTALIFIQFRTVRETDIAALELLRADELRAEIDLLRSMHEDVSARIVETNKLITEYQGLIASGQEASALFESELQIARNLVRKERCYGYGCNYKIRRCRSRNNSYGFNNITK